MSQPITRKRKRNPMYGPTDRLLYWIETIAYKHPVNKEYLQNRRETRIAHGEMMIKPEYADVLRDWRKGDWRGVGLTVAVFLVPPLVVLGAVIAAIELS